jgi:hypothetical protein
VEVE